MPHYSAPGLYAVLARDWSDFLEMINEPENTSSDTLNDLSRMLRLPNPKHTADTRELNGIGASCVKDQLEKRGLVEPELPAPRCDASDGYPQGTCGPPEACSRFPGCGCSGSM